MKLIAALTGFVLTTATAPAQVVVTDPVAHSLSKIHHSQVQRENNSNFGTIFFTWWDRLHRTLGLNIPQSDIVVGIPAYSLPGDNKLSSALLMPFRKQRDYWRTPHGPHVERDNAPGGGGSAHSCRVIGGLYGAVDAPACGS